MSLLRLPFHKSLLLLLFLVASHQGWAAFEIFPKVSYFRPQEELIRDIYSDHQASYGLEVRRLWWCLPAGFFVSGDYTINHGRSIGEGNPTKIKINNAYGGVLITPLSFDGFNLNIGGGGAATFLHIHDSSSFVKQNVRKATVGWIVKGDLSYHFCFLLLDLFAEYTSSEFSFGGGPSHSGKTILNTGGYRLGGGAGLRF